MKSLLQRQLRGGVFADWLGFTVAEWLRTETPRVSAGRADLLGRTTEGGLLHIELQSTNDPDMALRMAEYQLGFYRQYRKYAKQIVLYVGARPLRMEPAMPEDADSSFRCRIIDIREVPAEPLVASERLEDNVLSILARLSGARETVRRVLRRIAGAPPEQRRLALSELTILAGLREFGELSKRSEKQCQFSTTSWTTTCWDPYCVGVWPKEGSRASGGSCSAWFAGASGNLLHR